MHSWQDLKIFELAIENAYDHIIITDPKAKILYANEAVTRVTGYFPEEIIGKTPNLWGGLMPKPFYIKFWKRLLEEKKPFIGEIRNRRKNGETYYAEIRVTPVLSRFGKVKFFVGIERDITKLKEIDKIKTEVISLTAHQLQNSPAVIKMYTDSLLDGIAGKLNEKQTEYVEEISNANENNIHLIGALLNITRLELGTFHHQEELTDISKACKSVISILRPAIYEKQLKVISNCDERLKKMLIDRASFEIILHNLLSNACKYSHEKGEIHITVSPKKGSNSRFLLTVQDSGLGIPKAEQSRVFTKMFRAGNARMFDPNGTGLGLYMVELILKQLRGSIHFESAEGKGSTFYVTFPFKKKQ